MTEKDSQTDTPEEFSNLRSHYEAGELSTKEFERAILRVVHNSSQLDLRDAGKIIDKATDKDVYNLDEESPPVNSFELQPPD